MVITVDDGRRDFYLNAYPILREYALPAMMYLPAAYLDGEWLWFHRYQYIFERTKLKPVECRDLPPLDGATLDLSLQAARAEAFSVVVRRAQWFPVEQRDGFADALGKLSRALTRKSAGRVHSSRMGQGARDTRHGIEFGGHTLNHPILQTISAEECLQAEIAGCKARIEQDLQKAVGHFAYPSGKEEEISAAAKKVVQRCGYEAPVTTVLGRVSPGTDPFWLPRVGAAPNSDWLWFRRYVGYIGMSR